MDSELLQRLEDLEKSSEELLNKIRASAEEINHTNHNTR